MKILLIGRYGEGSILPGSERFGRELYCGLKDKNPEIEFVEYFFKGYGGSTFGKRLFGRMTPADGNSVQRFGIFPLFFKLISEQYDVIHLVNLQRFFIFIFLLKPFLKSKFTATLHGFLRFEIPSKHLIRNRNYLDLLVEKLIVKNSDLIIFPSSVLKELFRHYYQSKLGKHEIIPNGIGKIFRNSSSSFPPVAGFINVVFYNGFSGPIERGINLVHNLLGKSKSKIKLYILGETDPGLKSKGNVEIIFSGLKNQNELTMFLEDKHIIIKSPLFDTFSIITAECMSLGLVPLITEKNGLIDYIEHGVNGFIYNESPDSENCLQKIIDRMMDGKFDLNSISCSAKKIYDILNWNIISDKYIQAYKNLI